VKTGLEKESLTSTEVIRRVM